MARFAWIFTVVGLLARISNADNDFTYTGSPIAGKPFTITWTPGTYSTIDILLNTLTGYPYYVPTTGVPIAEGIANSGTYVWNVPATLEGYYNLAIARDVNFAVSYSPKFALGPYTISTIDYATYTSVPQTTACTSAIPSPTGPNSFLTPDDAVLRVGVPFKVQWQPTTKGTVSLILNPSESNSYRTASAPILSNISNSGSFTWTPPNDSTLDGDGIGGWYLTLVDDATQETSTSTSFNILTPDAEDDFIGPYPPLVAGQDYTFNWSPSTQPTISLLIMRDSPEGPNVTLAEKIKNTGSFTWLVPSSDPFIIPGEWVFALVNDATGTTDAMVYITIDPTTPPLCGPQTMDALSSEIASFQSRISKNDGGGGPTGPGTTRTDASFLSIESELASLSSANAAKITKVTPHVLTTLGPSTTPGPGTGTRVQQLGKTQSGNLLSSTSKAGGGRSWEGESTGIWDASSSMFGLIIGLLGVFLG